MSNITIAGEPDPESPIGKFREKVADRIRGDIGDLMPDEMLQQIVKDTIQVELNRPTKIGSGYNATQAPWIRTEILNVIKPRLDAAVKAEIEAHQDAIKQMVKDEIKELIPGMFAEMMMAIVKGQSYSIEAIVQNFLMNRN